LYLSDLDTSLVTEQEALDCYSAVDDRAGVGYSLRGLGEVKRAQGNLVAAVDYYRQALAIGRETQDPNILWNAEAGLGACFEQLGEPGQAISHYANAVAVYDAVREGLEVDFLGSTFLADKYEAYPAIVRLLAEAGRAEEALAYAEKYKAKSILESLARSGNLLGDLLPEDLRRRWGEVENELEKIHTALASPEGSNPAASNVSLEERRTELELQKAELLAELRESHGDLYDLTLSSPLEVEAIQSQALGPQQALVEYVVGKDRSSVFVVTSEGLHYRNLPLGRDAIVEMMQGWSPVFGREDSTSRSAATRIFSPDLADFSIPPAQALYEGLLAPIEHWIEAGTELIIVPDDILFYVPFEALVVESRGQHRYAFNDATFLLEKYSVSYASAASLLVPGPREAQSAPRMLLALGNPEFGEEPEDGRELDVFDTAASYASTVFRGDRLIPLPNSEEEVRSIAEVVGGSSNQVLVGRDATEDAFKALAGDYRILHFATHFLTDDRQPLYSRLALATGRESQGDGSLQVYELFNTRLRADLVVLSACNTGLGRLQKGEGLMGASRAFLNAGVPSMVVSLWSVEDEATATIMERFYRHLKDGLNKRAALRQAKLDYLETAREEKKDPFYWAPFILIGDWQPLNLPERSFPFTTYFFLAFLAMAIWMLWRRTMYGRT
jgi:CHAT domain-containing protein